MSSKSSIEQQMKLKRKTSQLLKSLYVLYEAERNEEENPPPPLLRRNTSAITESNFIEEDDEDEIFVIPAPNAANQVKILLGPGISPNSRKGFLTTKRQSFLVPVGDLDIQHHEEKEKLTNKTEKSRKEKTVKIEVSPSFHHYDLTKVTSILPKEKYDIPVKSLTRIKHISDGSNSHVSKAVLNGSKIILKIAKLKCLTTPIIMKEYKHEIEILSRLNHPYICSILGAGYDDTTTEEKVIPFMI